MILLALIIARFGSKFVGGNPISDDFGRTQPLTVFNKIPLLLYADSADILEIETIQLGVSLAPLQDLGFCCLCCTLHHSPGRLGPKSLHRLRRRAGYRSK